MNFHLKRRGIRQYITPGTVSLAMFYIVVVTVSPIYMLADLRSALSSRDRVCGVGVVSAVRDDSPHLLLRNHEKEFTLTFPSNALSLKKRAFAKNYGVYSGERYTFCYVTYQPFGQNFLTLLESGDRTIISEDDARRIIRDETKIIDLVIVNVFSYAALVAYAIKYRRKDEQV